MEFSDFLKTEEKRGHRSAAQNDIMAMWQATNPYLPLDMSPVPYGHKGRRTDTDGIKITGRMTFILSALSRFKDLLQIDSRPDLELDVQIKRIKKVKSYSTEPKYACYIHLVYKK